MTTLRSRATPLVVAATTLATSAVLVAGAGPASAVPAAGRVSSGIAANSAAGCAIDRSPAGETVRFDNRTGARTAEADESYSASDSGTVGATGYANLETTASASAKRRAFQRLDVESTGVVVITNQAAADCDLEVQARSQAHATLKVRKRGRIRLTWSTSVGDLQLLTLTSPTRTLVNKDPGADGRVTVRVRRGTYQLGSRFLVSAEESEAADDASMTKVGFYTLKATFIS